MHRKQLRTVLNTHYPKIISNEMLYQKTGEIEMATTVEKDEKRIWGMSSEGKMSPAIFIICLDSKKGEGAARSPLIFSKHTEKTYN